jgi:hypothetical protein
MPPPPVLGKLPAAAAAFVSSPRLEPSTSSNKLLYDLDAIATTPPKKKQKKIPTHTLSLFQKPQNQSDVRAHIVSSKLLLISQ